MKITKISIVIAIIIGIIIIFIIPSAEQTLYFLPLIITINIIRIWEKAVKEK